MIAIGQFFFKYRNLIFPVFGIMIFIPSPTVFSLEAFGPEYYHFPLVAGLMIAILGQLIRALTIGLKYIIRGGKNKEVYAEDLVTEGIFHHCRNPLYVGNILMLLGVGILYNSLYFLIFVVPLFCFIYQAIVLAEEDFLKRKFGQEYKEYMTRVNRWVPSLKGLPATMTLMAFNWRRYILSEYNTVYLLLISILIVLVIRHPDLAGLAAHKRIKILVISFLTLSTIYLVVRYLKKSGLLRPAKGLS